MVKRFLYILVSLIFYSNVKAQLPGTTLNSQQTIGANTIKRDLTQINLEPGFKYSANAGSPYLLNLNISSYPTNVNTNYVDPTTNTFPGFNLNAEAAATEGSYAVSPFGSLLYDIPILCSPGTHGVEPKLSIKYNSQGVNGLLGVGWSLSGLSSISRITKNVFNDGATSPINLSTNDAFAIDGNRLFPKTGTYGTNGATYKGEKETFANISSIGVQGNGPQTFLVIDNKGNTITYGGTIGSRLSDISGGTVLSWYISNFEDELGNYMAFTYQNLSGEILVDKIEYTGNTISFTPFYNKITFEYIDRSDNTTIYYGGKPFESKHLLKSITCLDLNNQIVKKYVFDYQFNIYSLLYQIKEVDANGNDLNPTVIYWGEPSSTIPPPGFSYSTLGNNFTYPSLSPNLSALKSADLNGDGFGDIIAYQSGLNAQIFPMINNTGGMFNDPLPAQLGLMVYPNGVKNFLGLYNTDEDDDNQEEIVSITSIPAPSLAKTYLIHKLKADPITGVIGITGVMTRAQTTNIDLTPYNYSNIANANLIANPLPFFYDVNDYTGDGLKDQLICDQEKITLIPAGGYAQVTYPLGDNRSIVKSGDFDGDGKLEIYLFTLWMGVYVLSYDVPGATSLTLKTTYSSGIWGGPSGSFLKTVDVGDINGDLKADIISKQYGQFAIITFNLSDGVKFLPDVVVQGGVSLSGNKDEDEILFLTDVNHDNKADIVNKIVANYNNIARYYVYYSEGNNFSQPFSFTQNENPVASTFGDFNADGDIDFFSHEFTIAQQEHITFKPFPNDRRHFVTKIQNVKKSLDVVYNYLPAAFDLNALKVFYEKSISPNITAPFQNYKPSTYVVRQVNYSGNQFSYSYGNGILHRNGHGFLGFEKTKVVEDNDLLGSITTNTYNSTFSTLESTQILNGKFSYLLSGLGANIKYFDIITSKITSRTFNSFGIITSSPLKGFYVANNFTQTKDYLKSIDLDENSFFDKNQGGNLGYITKSYFPWAGGLEVLQQQQIFTYGAINGIYKIQNIVSKSSENGQPYYTRSTDFTYDPQSRLVSTVADVGISANPITTTYGSFDAFGNPTNIVLSAGDIQTQTTQKNYDPTGRFVVKNTNPLNDVEEFVYETKFGNVIQTKNISGLLTSFQYDGLGRLIQTKLPNNAINTIKYEWNTSNPGFYDITKSDEGFPQKILSFDNLDKIIKTQEQGFNGATIVSTNTYDSRNRLTQSEDAHFSTQTKYRITQHFYESDFFREQTTKINIFNTGNISLENQFDYSYNGLSTDANYQKSFVQVKTLSNNYTKKENNEAGQIDKVTNMDNTLVPQTSIYTFHSCGKPKQITVTFAGGTTNTTQFDYDALGRQNLLNDQSSGITTYLYNSLGQLTQQNTPNGNYTFAYDLIGRLQTKTGPSGATNYQYVTVQNGLEQIEKITGPNNVTEFKYDNLTHVTDYTETIDNKIFKTSYAYDKYNNITNYTYPNGFSIKREYDGIGNLLDIKNGNQLIWQLNSLNTPNQIEQYTYGNGITTNINYDNFSNIKEIIHGNIHKQEYQIDNISGNVLMRKFTNYITGTVNYDNFSYDGFQRLTQVYDLTGGFNLKTGITYQANGNINQKTDAGNYVYGLNNKPFTLTNINNATNNISLNNLSILYNDIRKVSKITENGTNNEMDFTYGNNDERIKMEYLPAGVKQYTRYYCQNYDREETPTITKEWDYIYSPTGLVAVYSTTNAANSLSYVLSDHLGSPVMLTNTNNTPQIIEEYNFDAWGRRRNPINWTYTGVTSPQFLKRGFTFHEHIDEFGLINMNGRIYDPVLGRFIQSDNYVQSPYVLQNFNRYAYVNNNPLKYTDPSGNFGEEDLAAILAGGINNVVSNWSSISNGNQFSVWAGIEYFTVGAIAGEATLYGGPVAGFLVGGTLNLTLDAARGNFSDDNLNGQNIYLSELQSFSRGALSGLAAGEAAAEVSEASESAPGSSSSFKNFYELITGPYKVGPVLRRAAYFGIKSILDDFAKNQYQGTAADVFADIAGSFVKGNTSSMASDFIENDNLFDVGHSKGIAFPIKKISSIFSSSVLGTLAGNAATSFLHKNQTFGATKKYSPPQSNNSSFSALGLAEEDVSTILILSILKWK